LQVIGRSPSRPWTAKQPGAGFEPLSLRHTNGSSHPRFHSGRCRWARTGSVPAAIWRHPGPSPGGPRALPSRTGTDTGRYRA
jgi:hypothetical protein